MSEHAEVFEFLKELIVEMKDYEEGVVQRDSSFESLELDSLDYVEVQVGVKKRYGVALTPDLFSSGKIANIEQMVSYITKEPSGEFAPQN